MTKFRLTQISDTHLARRLQLLTDNFDHVRAHIDATRPDLVINSGDLSFDGPTSRKDLEFAKSLHEALPVPCRYLPGNHDLGDNPTAIGPVPSHPATEQLRKNFIDVIGEDRWRFDEAGWCFIGLELADHEHRYRKRGGAVRLARVRTRTRQRQAGGAVHPQAAVSRHARRSRA